MTVAANRTLIQEELRDEGSEHWQFWMLVACMLMNKTRGEQVRPVLAKLRNAMPEPRDWFANANMPSQFLRTKSSIFDTVHEAVKPLGFGNIRPWRLTALAQWWMAWQEMDRELTSAEVRTIPGCGRYAADSWAIFVEGRRDVSPTDKELRAYLRRTAVG